MKDIYWRGLLTSPIAYPLYIVGRILLTLGVLINSGRREAKNIWKITK